MALGTAVINGEFKRSASAPLDVVDVSFPGDAAYVAGGTAGFQAYIRNEVLAKRNVSVIAVLAAGLNDGYDAIYDVANDKLVLKAGGVEVANGDYSATVFRLTVLAY